MASIDPIPCLGFAPNLDSAESRLTFDSELTRVERIGLLANVDRGEA